MKDRHHRASDSFSLRNKAKNFALVADSETGYLNPVYSRIVIFSLGNRLYRVGDSDPVELEENEDTVLQAFMEQSTMSGPKLIDKAGFDNAPKVLRTIPKKYPRFASAIRLSGNKGKGGYHVLIQSAVMRPL